MTFTPKTLRSAIERDAREKSVVETSTRLSFVVHAITSEAIKEWIDIRSAIVESRFEITCKDSSFESIELSPQSADEHTGTELTFEITKSSRQAGVFEFLFTQGLVHALESEDFVRTARVIRVAEEFAPFETSSSLFTSWPAFGDAALSEPSQICFDEPRQLVRALMATKKIPARAAPWLLIREPESSSEVYQAWRNASRPRLLFMLPDDVWENDGSYSIRLHGPRRIDAKLNGQTLTDEQWDEIAKAVNWIYGSSSDASVRHTMFTYELAREWNDGDPYEQGLASHVSNAVEAARTCYRAYVAGLLKESTAALVEMRKSLADEFGRIAAQTRELSSAMWRDFALAFGALAVRVSVPAKTAGVAVSSTVRGLLIAVACFLMASIVMTLLANSRLQATQLKLRNHWRSRLYGFLDETEYRSVCLNPWQELISSYKLTAWVISCLYVLMIVALIILAYMGSGWTPNLDAVVRIVRGWFVGN